MAHQDSPSVKETSNGPPESAKSTEAEKAIMEDGDLNKLLQLAQHCSKQMSASDDETKDSNDAIPNSEDTVLAASSLHLPLIEGRSFLDNEKNTKLSSQSNGYINNDGNKSRSTEKALLSLKHQNIDSYKTDEDQNEKGKGAGRRSLAKGPSRPQNKTKPTPTRKKVKQKQSQSELLAAALLRGVTMRPSGKWQAQLYYAGKSRYIGVFDTREKAAKAYEIAREKLKSSSNPNEGSQSPEVTESAVAAARKAAFDGVSKR